MKTIQQKISEQMEYVQDQIINGSNSEQFNIINMEAGSFKSVAAHAAFANLYKIDPSRKSILVMKFKDVKKDGQDLCPIYEKINKLAGHEIAVAIHSGNFREMKDRIKDFSVVIITHERYKRLSMNPIERQIFTEGRTILVIDEEIDMVQISENDLFRIDIFGNMVAHKTKLKETYIDCVEPIKEAIDKIKNKEVEFSENIKFVSLNYDINTKRKFRLLKKLIDRYITDEYARQFQKNMLTRKKNDIKDMTKKDFENEIRLIEKFYQNVCYLNRDNIYTYDKKIQYWKLQNNILLDANGGFNHCYKLAPQLFRCSNQSKIFDHSNWVINVAYNNVTKTAIRNYTNYNEEIERLIGEITINKKKTLVITSKQFEANLKQKFEKKGEEVACIDHFGNIIGKNEWREYSQILIPSTYNLPEHGYILKYLYYSNNNIKIDTSTKIRKGEMKKFRNSDLEKIRVSFIAGETYQAIKRINRSMTMDTEVFLICYDKKVIETVKKQLENCKSSFFFLRLQNIKKEKKKYDTYSRRVECYTNNFINLLSTLQVGKYQKKELRAKLGITKLPNFSRIFMDEAFIKFTDKNKINIESRFIEILQPVQI